MSRGVQLEAAAAARSAIVKHMDVLLQNNGVLVLPTTRGAAPPAEPPADYEGPSEILLAVGSLAALGGLPQAASRPVPALPPVPVHFGLATRLWGPTPLILHGLVDLLKWLPVGFMAVLVTI